MQNSLGRSEILKKRMLNPLDPSKNSGQSTDSTDQTKSVDSASSGSVDSTRSNGQAATSTKADVASAVNQLGQSIGRQPSSYGKATKENAQSLEPFSPFKSLKLPFKTQANVATQDAASSVPEGSVTYQPSKLKLSSAQASTLQNGHANPRSRALTFVYFVEHSSVDQLQAIGCLNLGRAAKIINGAFKNGHLTSTDVPNARVEMIEKKVQQAFVRSYNSTCIDHGSASSVIERAAYNAHINATDLKMKVDVSPQVFLEMCDLFTNNIQFLKGMNNEELSSLSVAFSQAGNSPENAAHRQEFSDAYLKLNEFMSSDPDASHTQFVGFNLVRPNDHVESKAEGSILHSKTLFAEVHQVLEKHGLVDVPGIEAPVVRSVVNNVSVESFVSNLQQTLVLNNVDQSTINSISAELDQLVLRFTPTQNLGVQMDSPKAKKLENHFANLCLAQPTRAMKSTSLKMISQLDSLGTLNQQISDYVSSIDSSNGGEGLLCLWSCKQGKISR